MKTLPLIIGCLPLLGAVSCSRHQPPTPRRQAYVRPLPLASTYHFEHGVAINDSAYTEAGENGGFNIIYPQYGAKVMVGKYRTFNIPKALENRLERITINLCGAQGEMTSLTTGNGHGAILFTSPQSLTTPVQFVATDSLTWVMSGALMFDNPGTQPDSLLPYIVTIEADMLHLLKQL